MPSAHMPIVSAFAGKGVGSYRSYTGGFLPVVFTKEITPGVLTFLFFLSETVF